MGLGLFDNNVHPEAKRMMTAAMLKKSTSKNDQTKREASMACCSLSLEKFVTEETRRFFNRLHLQCKFWEHSVLE